MIEKFDYQEPACSLCSGKDFYYPEADAPLGRIPVERIISKVDSLFDRNDYAEAGRLLVYWKNEAAALKDKQGELSIQNELVGYYRKQNDAENGLSSVLRALELIETLEQSSLTSGATIYLNCATAYNAFGLTEESLPLYQRAEQIYKKHLSPDDARFGGLYNNMALTLVDLGRFAEAEAAYMSALRVMAKVPRGEAESAITYINLAYLYERTAGAEQIADCIKKARTLLQSKALPRDGYYAFVLEKCAPAFRYFGDAVLCDQMMKESNDIYART